METTNKQVSAKKSAAAAAAVASAKPVSIAERVLSSFVGKESDYKEFIKTTLKNTLMSGLNLRIIKDVLHFFPGGNEAIAKKVARGLEVSSMIKTLSYELNEIDSDLKAFSSAVIEAWSKEYGKVSSLRMVPSEDHLDTSVLVTVKDSFSIEKSMLAALKNKIGEEKYSILFNEEKTLTLKNGEFRSLVISFLRKTFGKDAVEKIFDENVTTKVNAGEYNKLMDSSEFDEETKKLIQNVIIRATPSVKYPK